MGGSSGDVPDLINILIDRAVAYGREVIREKGKIMTNNTNSISSDISMNCQKLEDVISFK